MKQYLTIALVFFSLLFFVQEASAAITVVHTNTPQSGSGTTCAETITSSGSGNLLVVSTLVSAAAITVTSVTDNATGGSNTYVQATSSRAATTVLSGDIWFAKNSSPGATTVTVHFNNSSAGCVVQTMEYAGADVSAPFEIGISGTGLTSTTAITASTTTSLPGDLIFAAVGGETANTINSVASPYTIRHHTAGYGTGDADYITTSTVTNSHASFVFSATSPYETNVAVFKPAVAAAAPPMAFNWIMDD
jgi:hypothetical protein